MNSTTVTVVLLAAAAVGVAAAVMLTVLHFSTARFLVGVVIEIARRAWPSILPLLLKFFVRYDLKTEELYLDTIKSGGRWDYRTKKPSLSK
jgi:hypothetical protein